MNVEEVLIILYTVLKQKSLTSVQEFVFCQTWQGKTYAEMADNSSYDAEYLKFVGFQVWRLLSKALDVKVNKCNLHSVLREKARQISGLATSVPGKLQNREAIALKRQDWGEAVDTSVFYGRTEELAILEQWIVKDSCRLVAVLGIGGIGKTAYL